MGDNEWKNALERVGLVNYFTEWWHWSYGDKYWAYCLKNNCAIYSPIDEPNVTTDY